ncbi:MAG: flagellar basal body P-ring protein FlgI [Chitinispirillales bacterium]|jgi:flagellar P-ring protein precursor FlgI|nr:flagellar basal body P-ring protein FlgI [Chitinispirillales bacterium]
MKKITAILFIAAFSMSLFAATNVRIKDVAKINGVEDLQIYGYGLVVGLAGTGDRMNTVFTTQTMKNMLKNMGIELPEKQITMRNVAAVMVTGTVDPFKKRGTRIDIMVSSIGDARSLEGGTLILTPLQGPDGEMYATAQGALSTGGFDIRNRGLSKTTMNHTLVGRVPDGAIIQREYIFNEFNGVDLALSLDKPDFTSAVSMATAINGYFTQFGTEGRIAQAIDASTVTLNYNLSSRAISTVENPLGLAEFISIVENVTFDVATSAKVVMNERTGTIVAGGNVRISQITLTHGGIKVEITNKPAIIQPMPFTFGRTATIPNPEVVVEQKDMDMVVLDETTTASDLAQALNSLGVASRDIISIFQAIKEAGALQAQLIII